GDAELATHGHDLVHVGLELFIRAVDGRTLDARELELAPGLEGDRRAGARERHRTAVLFLGLPGVAFREGAQHGLDAARAGERRRFTRRPIDPDLLVLGADHPALRGLAGAMQLLDQLIDTADRRRVGTLHEVGHRVRGTLARWVSCRNKSGATATAMG